MPLLMKRGIIMLFTLCLAVWFGATTSAQTSDHERARYYQRQAEHHQKQAERHRDEAAYFLKLAERSQKEAAYYIKHGDIDRAEMYSRKASRYMKKYETQLRYARQDDEKAAMYFQKAANALK